ncbi:hypothetical protein C8R47DRAFT_253383 [Mycena vitilis]|nr:hypothetical protein C8R47DRAFT_253383 [Mycena vitilis]
MFAFRSLLVLTAVAVGIATPTQHTVSPAVQCIEDLATALGVLNTSCAALTIGASAATQANAMGMQAGVVQAKISSCTDVLAPDATDCPEVQATLVALAQPVTASLNCITLKKNIITTVPGGVAKVLAALKGLDAKTKAYIEKLIAKCPALQASLKMSEMALGGAFGKCEAGYA